MILKKIMNEGKKCEACGKYPCECLKEEKLPEEEFEMEEEEIQVQQPEEEEVEVKEEERMEVENSLPKGIYVDTLNSSIQRSWDAISELNSIISTFDYDYKEANKEDIMKILNEVVDQTTINIGMLYKVVELLPTDTADLIADGQEKAEKIID